MKRFFAALMMAGATLLTTGCATVTPQVAVGSKFWENRQGTIAISQAAIPAPAAFQEGSQGLLDVAINQGMASDLNKHLQTLSTARAAAIPDNFSRLLTDRGFSVKKLDKPVDESALPDFKQASGTGGVYAKKDYRSLKSEGVDRLLVIQVKRSGTARPYYGFIPLAGPSVVFDVTGQLIDLSTNELLWNHDGTNRALVPDPWDQPPTFGNITASLTEQMEKGSAAFERTFFAEPSQAQATSR